MRAAAQSLYPETASVMQIVLKGELLFAALALGLAASEGTHDCGSTLPELPRDACPDCAGPVSRYTRVDTGT